MLKKKKIKVAMMRVQEGQPKRLYISEIENDLKALQSYVGGLIQVVGLVDGIDIICNDEGKLKNLPLNRAWFYDGSLADIFCGDILACRSDDQGNFDDIREEDIDEIKKYLKPYVCTILGNFIVPDDVVPEFKAERGIQDENE